MTTLTEPKWNYSTTRELHGEAQLYFDGIFGEAVTEEISRNVLVETQIDMYLRLQEYIYDQRHQAVKQFVEQNYV